MSLDKVFNILIEEAKRVNGTIKMADGKVVYKFTPLDLVIGDIVPNTIATRRLLFDNLAFIFKNEILNFLGENSGSPSLFPPDKKKKTKDLTSPNGNGNGNGNGSLTASTIHKGFLLNEYTSEKVNKMIREWTKGMANYFYSSSKLGKNKAEVKHFLILEARKITSLETFRVTVFWEYQTERIQEIIREAGPTIEDAIDRFKRSIRGGVSNRFGTGMENVIKNAIKTGNYSEITWLSPIKNIIDMLEEENEASIIVKKPRGSILAYDLEIKIPYSKEILVGVHIKLVVSSFSVVSMNNGFPYFTSTSFETIKKAIADNNMDCETYIKKNTKIKGENTIVFNTLGFMRECFDTKTTITDPSIIDVMTLVCRVSHKNSLWIISFQDKGEVSFSEKTSKITKRKGFYLFYNEDDDLIFKMNATTGLTTPVLTEKRKGSVKTKQIPAD